MDTQTPITTAHDLSMEPQSTAHQMLNKVPAATLAFWVIKIMATTVGETGADFLAVSWLSMSAWERRSPA